MYTFLYIYVNKMFCFVLRKKYEKEKTEKEETDGFSFLH